MDPTEQRGLLFQWLNELGIVNQLALARLARLMPDDLHVAHFGVLNHLVRLGDGRTPLQIASAFQVSKATMTNTLMRLAEKELIRFQVNPSDGRSKLVMLTPRGRDCRAQAIAALEPDLDFIAARVDIAGLAGTLPLLQALREVLDRHRDLP